jgi:hypothetical protein
MKSLVVSSTLPIVSANFKEIKSGLAEQLKQFDLIVDEDSVKTAKSMATQINKMSKEIDDLRKKEIEKLSAPLREFEDKIKELKNLCQKSRQNLLSQVKIYDEKRLTQVKELLLTELQSRYDHYGVKQEFQSVKIEDLAILSNLNSGGSLAKKARDAIDERVNDVKKLQEKINTRLLTLGEICFKGGLNAPLTRENINHFLFVESDDKYLDKLVSLIDNELKRSLESEKRRARAGENAAASAVVDKSKSEVRTQIQKPQQQRNSIMNRFKNAKEFSPKSKMKKLIISATFEMEVKEDMNEEMLKMIMLKKFDESQQFKMIPDIQIRKLVSQEVM